jgi:hypothetical protein
MQQMGMQFTPPQFGKASPKNDGGAQGGGSLL